MVAGLNGTDLVQVIKFSLEGVAYTPIAIVGLFGNLLSIAVLSQPEMKGSFNQLLLCLSSFDLLYLLMSMLIFVLPQLSTPYTLFIYPRLMPIGFGLVHISRVGSVLMTLSVTVERFFAIVHPLRDVRMTTPLIAASTIVSVVYNVPRFMEFTAVCSDANCSKSTMDLDATSLRLNPLYIQIYVVWMKLFFIELIPYMLILVLNSIMIAKIRGSARNQQQMSGFGQMCRRSSETERINLRRERNTALVLISIVIIFIVCQSIKIVPDIWEAWEGTGTWCQPASSQECQGHNDKLVIFEILVSVSVLGVGINSSSNFLIYMLRGRKFRRMARKTLCQWIGLRNHSEADRRDMRYRYVARNLVSLKDNTSRRESQRSTLMTQRTSLANQINN